MEVGIMINVIKSAYIFFNKIKVVHSIQGRLRLNVPGLNKVPEDMKKYEHYITDIIKMSSGIKEVEYSYITSKLLIIYDSKITNEKKIIDWLDLMWKTIMDNQILYENMSQKEIEENAEKFYEILHNKMKYMILK